MRQRSSSGRNLPVSSGEQGQMLWYLQWVLSHSVYNRSLTATLQRAPARLAYVSAFTTLCFLAYLCKPHSRFGKLLGLRKSMQTDF